VSARWLLWIFALLAIYLALFHDLGRLAFVGADEPRYARIAEEMNLRRSYVTPTLEFIPWLEKPPLLFWVEAVSFKAFGVSEWAARFPVALLAALGALAAAEFALRCAGPRAAWIAALILPTSGLFFVYGRAASTDMPLTCFLTIALANGYAATAGRSQWRALAAGAALGLAVLAKGPIAIFLFAGVFGVYFLVVRRFGWDLRQTVIGGAAAAAVATPWFYAVWRENGYDFLATFFLNHHLSRFLTAIHHHAQPFWYYLPVLVVGFFPWVCFLGPAARRLWRKRDAWTAEGGCPELFLWIWAAFPVLLFSMSMSKLPGYVLPVLPPLALLAALEWDRRLEGEATASRSLSVQSALLGVLAVLLAAGVLWTFTARYERPAIGLIVTLPLLLGVGAAGFAARRERPASMLLSLVASMACFAALAYSAAAPVVDDFHSARDLAAAARPLVSPREPLVLYRYFHHTALYYSDYRCTREALGDLNALRTYAASHPQQSYLVLTQAPGWKELEEECRARLARRQGNLYLVRIAYRAL
jgi:4-amino-4-deoxy-L-arabinose transferase-like glycosyltransferase